MARKRSSKITPTKLATELSSSMKDALRALCEGWNGPDHPEQRTLVALARRKLVVLYFADQENGSTVRLRGDRHKRRYHWRTTPLGSEVYEKIRLSKQSIPTDWNRMAVRPKGKPFVRRAALRRRY